MGNSADGQYGQIDSGAQAKDGLSHGKGRRQMNKTARKKKTFNVYGIGRWFKYQYLLLTRAKGGPVMVALGFSIGLAVEMFTLPTAGLAFFLIFPLVYSLRASMGAALIGFVFGKVIYLPMSFINKQVGALVLPHGVTMHLQSILPEWLNTFLRLNMKLLVGGIINGAVLGLLVFYPVKWMLEWVDGKRKEKRRRRKEQLLSSEAEG
ncbi:DUF2062 domain-containing protein [Paenibacillus sp. Pae15]|nr:DUF2062 domain-containing protein [Paenibacillus sp. Pae15]